jgi:hypothetical protein
LFSALGIRIKAGREFDEQDRADALPVGIINETMRDATGRVKIPLEENSA